MPIRQIVTPEAEGARVNMNPTQYNDGVTPDLWSYQIGGYQVLAKWLKDRKDRFLTSADTIYYSRIVTALAKTIGIQAKIDCEIAGIIGTSSVELFSKH